MEGPDDDQPQKRGGGPNTSAGKKISSMNRLTHGLRSKVLILDDECQEDFDETREGWMAEYEPEGYHELRLVNTLILNDWLMQRAHRKYMEKEAEIFAAEIPGSATKSEGERSAELLLIQRYKTTAERAFYRSLQAVQQLRKEKRQMRIQDSMLISRLESSQQDNVALKSRNTKLEEVIRELEGRKAEEEAQPKADAPPPRPKAAEVFAGQLNAKKNPKKKKEVRLEQWVEIRVREGKTTTMLFPPNDELIKRGQKMWPPPTLVYRRMNFPDGVPEEYAWCTDDPLTREIGGLAIQRMSADSWLEQIEEEKDVLDGHILSIGLRTLPRPEEAGLCDCPTCVDAMHRLKALEQVG